MAKKGFIKDLNDVEILPITRGELVIDSSGKEAFHSNEFLATTSLPGLMSAEDKNKLDNLEGSIKYDIVSTNADGLAPKINTTASAITTQTDEWVLTTTKGATPSWRRLPVNAFLNRPISVNGTSILENNNTALNLVAGNNITLVPEKDTGKVTIHSNITDITGNAATADKLKNKVKLWGLEFDGSSDVSGSLTGVGDIYIDVTNNLDRYITFNNGYVGSIPFSWRLGYLGTGSGDANYFVIQSGKESGSTWYDALKLGLITLNATFAGTVTAPTFNGKLAYTNLTGSTTTANQVIVSNGTANGWELKTLGSHAFDSTEYVTLNTALTITGQKTFSSPLIIQNDTLDQSITFVAGGFNDAAYDYKIGKFIDSKDIGGFGIASKNRDGSFTKFLYITYGGSYNTTGVGFTVPTTASKFITNGGTASQFVKGDGSLDSNSYATTSSLGAYLPLSGGTMTGPIILTSGGETAYDKKTLSFISTTGTELVRIGTDINNNLGLYSKGAIYIRPNHALTTSNTNGIILSSTQFTYNGYKVWHAGNSNLKTVDWSANKLILSTQTTSDWDVTRGTGAIQFLRNGDTKGTAPVIYCSGISIMTGYTGFQLATYGGSLNNLYFRSISDSGIWQPWKIIAFTDSDITGNAATATKLKTARKLWGQSFDGTEDVNGTITFSDGLTSNKTIQFKGGEFFDQSGNFYLNGTNEDTNSFNIFKANTDGTSTHLFHLSETKLAHFYGILTAPIFQGNLDGTYINKLTGYTKATTASDLVETDTLNIALGKLEYKADIAYSWYRSITLDDTDEIINKWDEVVDFVNGLEVDLTEEFVTRKTDLVITGVKTFLNGSNAGKIKLENGNIISSLNVDGDWARRLYFGNTSGNTSVMASFGVLGSGINSDTENKIKYVYIAHQDLDHDSATFKVYANRATILNNTILHAGNFNSYAPTLTGIGAKGDWNININGGIIPKAIASGDDLNNYLTNGRYHAFPSKVSKSLLNNPMSSQKNGVILDVIEDTSGALQILYGTVLGGLFTRRYAYNNWSNWTEYLKVSDLLNKIKSVDGSGSELDADLLDGQHASYFATAASLNSYLPLAGGNMNNDAIVYFSQYLTRKLKISGNDLVFNVSETSGGWSGGVYLNYNGTPVNVLTWRGEATTLSSISIGNININNLIHSGNYTAYTPILNSASTHATNASIIYAPSTAGTQGLILTSNGSGAPIWSNPANLAIGTANTIKIGIASGNVDYPVLFTTSTSADNTAPVYIDSDNKITINPRTNTITATYFNGILYLGYITPFIISLPNTSTVKDAKDLLVTYFSKISEGVGANATVSASVINNWDSESTTLYVSSEYSVIKIGGSYSGTTYGLWLLSTLSDKRIGYVGRYENTWTSIKWLATTEDINSLKNYYWADIQISSSANANTSPTFAYPTSKYLKFTNDTEIIGYIGKGAANSNGLYFANYKNSDVSICTDNNTSHCIYLKTGGNVGIGTTNPSFKLDVNGVVKATQFYSMRDAVSDVPMFYAGCADNKDVTILRINASAKNTIYLSNYGYSLKYLGTGRETDNKLVLYADNSTSASLNVSIAINNSGLVGLRGNPNTSYTLTVHGHTYSSGFVRASSSDSYVLLGGGGHKAISDFLLKSELANLELSNNLTTINKELTVTQDWMDTGIAYNSLPASGTYIIQVLVSANDGTGLMYYCYWSGIMSWNIGITNDGESDEILLHRSGHAYNNTIYLRTIMSSSSDGRHLRLLIAANKNIGAAYTYTFKFKRII